MKKWQFSLVVVAMAAVSLAACGKALDPPPAKMSVTQAIFTPVYRASKAIQGATGPGVTYAKFGELLQGLSTEIAIANDQQMNEIDKRLIAKYEESLWAYNFSAALWKQKIEAHQDFWKGEIPVGFKGQISPEFISGVAKFDLTPAPRVVPGTGDKYFALPSESIQAVWSVASAVLDSATEIYYGRSDGAATAPATGGVK